MAFLVFEALILFAAFAIVAAVHRPDAEAPAAELLAACLATKLILVGSIVTLTSGFGVNSWSALMGFALVGAACAWPRRGGVVKLVHSALDAVQIAPIAIIALVFMPLLAASVRPLSETDSLHYFSYVNSLRLNAASIYSHPANYPPFWELSFLPVMILEGTVRYLWTLQIQAILLFALSLAALALRLRTGATFAWILAVSGAAFNLFWTEPSGVATLKNDIIANAGVLVVGVGIGRTLAIRGIDGLAGLNIAVGAALALVKFGNLTQVASMAIPFAIVAAWMGAGLLLTSLVRSLAAIPLIIVTCGHVLVRNTVVHGSPVYPIAVTFFGHQLPGAVDLKGTSILSSAGNLQMWVSFLDLKFSIWRGGPAFAFILGIGSVMAASVLLSTIRRRSDPVLSWLALALPLLWLAYMSSFWSASSQPGDLFYIIDQASLRYASAAVSLTALLIVAASRGPLRYAAISLVAADAVGRVLMLYGVVFKYIGIGHFFLDVDAVEYWPWGLIAACFSIALVMPRVATAGSTQRVVGSAAALVVMLVPPWISTPLWHSRAKGIGAEQLAAVDKAIGAAPDASPAVLIASPALVSLGLVAHSTGGYYAVGIGMSRMARELRLEDVSTGSGAGYVIFHCKFGNPPTDDAIRRLDNFMVERRHMRISPSGCTLVYAGIYAAQGGIETAATAGVDVSCLTAGSVCNGPPASPGIDYLTFDPPVVWRSSVVGPRRPMIIGSGDRVQVQSMGLLDTTGRPKGLIVTMQESGEFIGYAATLGAGSTLTQLRPEAAEMGRWFITASAKVDGDWVERDGNKRLRLIASVPMAWLGIAVQRRPGDSSKLAVLGRAEGVGGAQPKVSIYDFDGGAVAFNATRPLPSGQMFAFSYDLGPDPSGDYFAIIATDVKPGQGIEIAVAQLVYGLFVPGQVLRLQ